jgi:hypothetical protein
VDVAVLDNDVAEVHSDPEGDPLFFRCPGIAFGHPSLHGNCAGDGLNHARELDQQAVAGGLDDAAPMLGYFGIGEVTANRPQCCERAGRMTTTRRLAAILAADVAGYSRLMGADEEGVNAGCNSNMRWMASRASCSRPRWAQATALQRYT